MSRAFVKESDRDEAVLSPGPELPPGAPNRITPAGAARLRDELVALQSERSGLRDADGAEARARRVAVEARAAWLQQRIGTLVETSTPDWPDRVVFGARVVLSDAEGDERTWQVVGVDEADPAAGRVTWLSPLAKAVLGAREGDVVRLRTPRGEEELEVVAVLGTA